MTSRESPSGTKRNWFPIGAVPKPSAVTSSDVRLRARLAVGSTKPPESKEGSPYRGKAEAWDRRLIHSGSTLTTSGARIQRTREQELETLSRSRACTVVTTLAAAINSRLAL